MIPRFTLDGIPRLILRNVNCSINRFTFRISIKVNFSLLYFTCIGLQISV